MTTDARLAADIASGAGALLLAIREAGLGSADGRELGRRGDVAANAFILGRLTTERPGDSILSEESVDDRSRLDNERVWIIDPLDGSKEYGLPGHADWAVHIALWERGRGITAAAVAQPALGVVHASDEVTLVGREAVPAHPRIVVSRSRPPAFIHAVASEIGAEVTELGSAGAKAMAVLRGEVDAYVHIGGQWEWDSAAPVGVALAAGLHCSRIDGKPLEYNESHPYLPDLVICRPEWATVLLEAIAKHATDAADSGRVAMARAYVDALLSHDATRVRLSPEAWRVENGRRTGESGIVIRDDLESGPRYQAIQAVRELSFHEWGENVVARFVLDLGADPSDVTSVRITEHFDIPAGEIQSITAVIEPVSPSS